MIPGVIGNGRKFNRPQARRREPIERSIPVAGIDRVSIGMDRDDPAEEIGIQLCPKLRLAGQDDGVERYAVVDLFDRVHDGPALESDAPCVVPDRWMGLDGLDRHRKVQVDLVARSPLPADADVTLDERRFEIVPLAVHPDLGRTAPAGDTDIDVEDRRFGGIHVDLDVLFPGILGRLLELKLRGLQRKRSRAGDKEVDVSAVFALGVNVATQRSKEAGDVGRAARASEPFLAVMIAPALERVS